MIVKIAVLFAAVCLSLPATAEIYKCVNDNGQTEFSDRPCSDTAETITLEEPATSGIDLGGYEEPARSGTDLGGHGDFSKVERGNDLRSIDRDIKKTERLIADFRKSHKSRMKYLDEMYESTPNDMKGSKLRRSILNEKAETSKTYRESMDKTHAILQSQYARRARIAAD